MNNVIPCCVLVFLVIQGASATKFELCGDPSGWISSVQVNDCADSVDTCILKRGVRMNISMAFESKAPAKTVTAVAHGIINGVPLPFFIPKADGCKYGGLSCPLLNGESCTYAHDLDIKSAYPPVEVKIKWELQDESKNDIICIQVNCKME